MELSLGGKCNTKEVFRVRTTTANLLDYANKNRNLRSFNDVIICAGDDTFPANKLVLSCFSPFFETMFKVEMKEKYQNTVKMTCIDADSMKNVIEFVYTGSISINGDNVCNLLYASDYLQIEDVKQFCFDFLSEAITPENSFLILRVAERFHNEALQLQADQIILENLDVTSDALEFKSFTKEKLVSYIGRQDQKQLKPTSLFTALVKWTKHDELSRADTFSQLLPLVSFNELPYNFTKDVIFKEDLVIQNNELCQLFLKVQNNRLEVFETKDKKSLILSIGGRYTLSQVNEVFNGLDQAQAKYPDLPSGRWKGCCIDLSNYIYFVGGCNENNTSEKTLWKMNVLESELGWKELSSMNNPKDWFGAAVFNESIVVAGGFHKNRALASASLYAPKLNAWKDISPLIQERGGNILVNCQNRLYCIGGVGVNHQCLSSVECLTWIEGKWENVSPMQTPRSKLAAVCHNGSLYAIGGKSQHNTPSARLKSVERYNSLTNEWSYMTDMSFKRSSFTACVLQGSIFVIGGVDENEEVVKEIECYNPLTDKWTVVGQTDKRYVAHALITM